MPVQRTAVARPLAEVTAMAGLLTSYVWVWGNTFEGDFTLCAILYFAIGLASHVRAGESAAEIGFQLRNVRASARDALLVTIPIVAGAGANNNGVAEWTLGDTYRTFFVGLNNQGAAVTTAVVHVDNIRFASAIPEPGCLMLAAGGVMALSTTRRR